MKNTIVVKTSSHVTGIRREESKNVPVKRAKPLTLKILEEALPLLDDDSIKTWRTVWRMYICFFCFLRFDDLKRVKVMVVQ